MAAHRNDPIALLRQYSVNELERIAGDLHRSLGDLSVPIDVDQILERLPDVDLDIWPAMAKRYGLLGMVGINENGKIIVFVDDNLADEASRERRYRMTVAEELSHIILHGAAIKAVKSPTDFKAIQQHRQWYKFERNAKRLAAAILMPAANVLDDARKIYQEIVSKLPLELRYTNPEAVKKYTANKLADRYLISVEAMRYRLQEWPIQVMSKIEESMSQGLDFLE